MLLGGTPTLGAITLAFALSLSFLFAGDPRRGQSYEHGESFSVPKGNPRVAIAPCLHVYIGNYGIWEVWSVKTTIRCRVTRNARVSKSAARLITV